MKRTILVITSAFFLITFLANAQQERMPYGKNSHYLVGNPVVNHNTKSISFVEDGEVFYDDFESYSSDFDADIWEVKRSADIVGTNLIDATSPKWFVCKPTNFGGNGSTYIYSGVRSAAISYTAPDFSWLIKKDYFLVESDSVELNFWLYYYNNSTQEIITLFHVLVQEEGSEEWISLASWNDESPNNQFQEKVILSLAEFKDKVIRFAFVFENQSNGGYQLAIDNVFVGTTLGPKLNIEAVPIGFSYVPGILADTMEFKISAKVENFGLDLTDTIYLKADVLDPLENMSEYSLTINDTISVGEFKIYTIDDTTDYSNQGLYTTMLRLVDEHELDMFGVDTIELNITSNLFATDYGIVGGFSLGEGKTLGNLYPIKKPIIASGVQIGWANYSGDSDSIEFGVEIFEVNPLDSSLTSIYYQTFYRQSSEGNQYISYIIENTYLAPGAKYFVAVKQISTTPIGIAYDQKKTGSFWSLNLNGDLERFANPSFGNLAIRLIISQISTNNNLNLTIDDGENPVENALVHVEGFEEEFSTDIEGKVSIPLNNGRYIYRIVKEGFAEIVDTVKIFYASIDRNYSLEPEYKVTLSFSSLSKAPIPNVEILVSGKSAVSNEEGIADVFLTEGLHMLTAMKLGYNPVFQEIEVVNGDNEVNVEMEEGVSFNAKFIILDELQEPLNNVKVEIEGYGFKLTDEHGETIFSGLAPSLFISFTLYKQGLVYYSGTFSIADEDVEVTQEMEYFKYSVTFEITNGVVPVYNAAVSIDGYPSVNTNFVGLAQVEEVIPGENIPFTVSKSGYANFYGSLTILDTDIRYSVVLSPSTNNSFNENTFVNIYPNPNNGIFSIEGEGMMQIQVFDFAGRLIFSEQEVNQTITIDISNKPAGIFLVKVVNNQGSRTLKIVKL